MDAFLKPGRLTMNKVTLSVSVLALATGAAVVATPAAAQVGGPGMSFGHIPHLPPIHRPVIAPPPIPDWRGMIPHLPRPPHGVPGVMIPPPMPTALNNN
jgi:hypothetical protein